MGHYKRKPQARVLNIKLKTQITEGIKRGERL